MQLSGLVQAPRLWVADSRHERRVTWMELFFDLIFVAAVAEVGAPLGSDYSWAALLRYSFLFVLIWWAWSGHTLYSTRFDHDDVVQRGLILLQCFIAAVMAANAKEALDSRSSAGFGAAYAGMRIVLVVQYIRARRVPETRALTTRYAMGFGTRRGTLDRLCPARSSGTLLGLGAGLDHRFPDALACGETQRTFSARRDPLSERFGLFTIILLGEFVAAVMRGIESQEYWSFSAAATAFASMAFAFALRWWYFDVGQSASERHVRGKRQGILFQVWHYAHLPMFLGIGVAGVGFQRLISLKAEEQLTRSEGLVLCSGLAVLMAATISIAATSEPASKVRKRHYLWGQYALIAVLAPVALYAESLHRVALMAIVLATCCAQTLLGRGAVGPKAASHKAG